MNRLLIEDIYGYEHQVCPKDIIEVNEEENYTIIETSTHQILTKASALIVRNSISNALYL